jgi:3-oxoacyl-[acyl-carrier protein] reductase
MKFALVTGGSRGIGRAIALKLAKMEYHVLLNYRSNDAEANEAVKEIEQVGGLVTLMKFDVTDKAQIEKKLVAWIDSHPNDELEVLINNAGISSDALLMWMTDDQWNNVINTNLNSFFFVTRCVLNGMLVRKFGRIINVVSLSGLRGMPGQTNYSAAKAGVIGATKVLAQEVARRGITVNAVAPGFIATDMTKELNEKQLAALIPMQRFGKAEEVADLVGFIASKNSAYITGQVISINGGMY